MWYILNANAIEASEIARAFYFIFETLFITQLCFTKEFALILKKQ
jgi:hypothetical protein